MPTRGVATICGDGSPSGRRLEAQAERRVAQIEAGEGAVDAERDPDQPGAGGQARVGHGHAVPAAWRARRMASRSLEGLDGADEQRGREGDAARSRR